MTKTDLAAAVEFSWEAAYNNIQPVRPGMKVFKVSAKNGEGKEWKNSWNFSRRDLLSCAAL
jgi:hydrogenase nickel incorporation protein HypB